MRRWSSVFALAVAGALALLLAALPVAAMPTAQRATIRVGSPQKVSSQWPFWMAMQRGTFAAMGVDVDFDVTRTEPLTLQYLASNSIDVAVTTPGIALTAVEAGARVAVIGGLQNRMTYYLVGRPDVRTLADLRGKSVGVDQVRGALPAIAKALIAPSGLVADQDYELRVTGAQSERYAALSSNQTAATILAPPFDSRARAEGYNVLADTLHDLPPMQWNAYIVERGWAEAHRDALVGFLAALRVSAQWLYDPANREEAIQRLTNELNVDEAIIRGDYAFLVEQNQVFSRDASFDRDGVQQYITLFANEGLIPSPPPPLERYVDTSYWEASMQR
ncbi:MAG TPA: ABC transporter substrate-binding protein [Chloroflexota bacterium]|nr:ABC transporter substrate-binding protein [Chloroflexota bacterium]